jgi:hypothetical protein
VQSNQQKKLQEFVDVGRLERVTYDAEFFSQQIESCSQSRIDALVPAGLPKSYDDLRVKRNTVEYPDVYTEQIDLASIHRCIGIGDQLLAIAQSISS